MSKKELNKKSGMWACDKKITPELLEEIDEVERREREFFNRHGISQADIKQGHCYWVQVVAHEYNMMSKRKRVAVDTPIGRQAFILGFSMGKNYMRKLNPLRF